MSDNIANTYPSDYEKDPSGDRSVQTHKAETYMDMEELVKLNRQRSSTYALLARLYRKEIDQDLLDDLHGMRFPADTGNADVDKGYRLIANFLSNLWVNSLTDLAIDYVTSFIGDGIDAFSAAYPYESVYTSPKRLMTQDARDEVLSIYRSEGLDKLDTWKDSEDHLALELDFERILADRTVEALEAEDEDRACALLIVQKNFLEDHLAAWVPMMTADLKRFAKTDLYKGLAYLTDGFIETDQVFLIDILRDSKDENNVDENTKS